MTIKEKTRTLFWIRGSAIAGLLFLSSISLLPAHAEEEEAVNLSGDTPAAAAKSDFPNPYELTRNSWFILIPVAVLGYAALHFVAYPFLRVKKVPQVADFLPKDEASTDEV